MEFKRTPDECFNNLPGYPFEANYIQVPDGEGGELRMHYLDEGSADGQVVLLMHGQPAWSYLYRKMVPFFVAAMFDLKRRYLERKVSLILQSGERGIFCRNIHLRNSQKQR